jgi:hypothetical protein
MVFPFPGIEFDCRCGWIWQTVGSIRQLHSGRDGQTSSTIGGFPKAGLFITIRVKNRGVKLRGMPTIFGKFV